MSQPRAESPVLNQHSQLLARCDLRIEACNGSGHSRAPGGTDCWNVLDPITRQSYRVGWIERWLLTRPRRSHSLEQLYQMLRREYPELSILPEQFLSLAANFQQLGLLRVQGTPTPLKPKSNGFQSWLSSTVAWQIRGIQPDAILSRFAPRLDILFSRNAVLLWFAAALMTACGVAMEFQRLKSQAGQWDWLLSPASGGLLVAVFIATRAIHELGHAMVCKRYGVRVPDIGLFIILGAPCVYCDVSESWQLANRWQRAAVAAAGMYSEMLVATLAGCVWLATIEGPLNTLALQTMFVCSISTLLINANPLMKFDGYYLLADWLDEVNLRGKADRLALVWLHALALGRSNRPAVMSGHSLEQGKLTQKEHLTRVSEWEAGRTAEIAGASGPHSARKSLLLVFSFASWLYRAGLSLSIAAVIVSIYASWNFAWGGRAMAAIILFSWWVLPISRFSHSLYQEASRMQRRWRLFLLAALFLVALAALPVPTRKFASGWIQPAQTQGVFASTAAKMMECRIHDGQRVQAGQLLFRLSNQELAMRLTQRAAASEQAVARESSIRRQRDMHGFDLDLTPYEADRKTTQILYENTKREHQSLFVSARIPGYVLAQTVPNAEGPSRSDQTVPDATWCNPTEVGRVVPEGALLATICSEEMLAVIPLTDRQLSVVAAGTQVKLRVANPAGKVVQGRVAAVVQRDEVGFLANSDDHAAFHAQESIQSRTSGNSYAAIVEMPTWDSPQQRPFPGATVDAVFAAPSQTVFSLATDWLKTNLRFLAD